MCVCQSLSRICRHILFEIIENLMASFEAGSLQGIVTISALGERICTVFQQQYGCV